VKSWQVRPVGKMGESLHDDGHVEQD
jgi:hypothetical protein